jgi:hypothetical protein
MSSSAPLPSPDDDYSAPLDAHLNKAFWDAALTSVGARIRALEAIKVEWETLIAQGTGQALAVIQANVEPQLVELTTIIDQLKTDVSAAEDAIAVINAGGIDMSNVAGLSAALALKANISYVDAAIDALKGDAPAAYDTLVEIATKLSEDDSAIAGLLTEIAEKVPQTRKLIAGTGLKFNASGEAELSGDVTATLDFAPTIDAQAGTAVDKPMNSKNVADAITAQALKLGVPTSLAGLTEAPYTGIPSTAKRLTMVLYSVSPGGDSKLAIQLGTSAGFTATGYAEGGIASASGATSSYSELPTSILFNDTGANAGVRYGVAEFWSVGDSNKWMYRVTIMDGSRYNTILGEIALPGVLDRIRLFTATGVAFDSGNVNLLQG